MGSLRASPFLLWHEARFQGGIELSSRFYVPIQNSCSRFVTAADIDLTYLELVGPLLCLRSDERNGESDSDDETVGEIHVTIKWVVVNT